MNANQTRRSVLAALTTGVAGVGAFLVAIPFFSSLKPRKYRDMPYTDIDISNLKYGTLLVATHEGKPIYVLRRTPEQIQQLEKPSSKLKDPESNNSKQPAFAKSNTRSLNKEYFVSVGMCTHLGCAVKYEQNDQGYLPQEVVGGYFCPCHGAMYDGAGRVFENGLAPKNMEVPEYEFTSEGKIRVQSF